MNYISFAYLVILLQLVNLSVQQCTKTYTVKSGDYCWAVANSYGLTVDQLAALNPGLNCNNLQIGQVLCISTAVVTTAAPVTLGAVPYGCTYPYYVKSGDTCWAIMNTYGVDSATFNAYNPNLNCNNLQIGQCLCLSYAVVTTAAPVVTTAAPIITAAPTTYPPTTAAPIITVPPTTIAPVTYPPSTSSPILCQRAYIIQSGDTCDLIARYNGLTIDTFYALNPGINCANLQVGQAVCLSAYSQGTVAPIVTTVAPVVTTAAPIVTAAPVVTTLAPVATTLAACYCANPYYVKSGDYCYKIMSDYAVDSTTFYSLNPGINCNNLQIGQCVCLPTRTAACTNKYAVKGGDYCWAIANSYGLTVDQLVALNPGIDCNNLQIGQVLSIRGTCY